MWARLVHYQYYENWRITWVWHHSRIMIWEWLAEVGDCNRRVRELEDCGKGRKGIDGHWGVLCLLTAGCWTLLNQGSGLRTHGSSNPFVGLRSGLMLPIIVDVSYLILCLGRVRSGAPQAGQNIEKQTNMYWMILHARLWAPLSQPKSARLT